MSPLSRLRVCVPFALISACLFALAPRMEGQSSAPPPQTPAPANGPGTATLHTNARLVVVDVVVHDKDGKPVHGLKREDFQVTENNTPQTARNFEVHSTSDPAQAGPKLPPMPPGMFTNYDPVATNGPLNVLLLDVLNTPMLDQAYVRSQLRQYVKNAPAGARIAIFGLNTDLVMLQGFTTDPAVLANAVEHKLTSRNSALLNDGGSSSAQPFDMSAATANNPDDSPIMGANLTNFEQQSQALALSLRMSVTLDAFDSLAHYLSSFPGRKNVIWFSGSFPMTIEPDPSLKNPFVDTIDGATEFRDAVNLLARAQVAIYPVDARGLMTNPAMDATHVDDTYKNSKAVVTEAQKNFGVQADEHATMEEMAEKTGGRAFYNTNNLVDAVNKAMDAGSNYYTLSYSPTDPNWNGNFRTIKLQLTGDLAHKGYTLSYRRGYYADDPLDRKRSATAAVVTENSVAKLNSDAAYVRIALRHGSPLPQDILIKVRVLPASATTEDTLARDNAIDPARPLSAPYRRFDVDYSVLGSDLQFDQAPNGSRTDTLEFKVRVYDPEGHLLVTTNHNIKLVLSPEQYKQMLLHGVSLHTPVSTPAKGESFLRIAVHDVNSNKMGVVEVPVSKVAGLPPPHAPGPAAAPAKTGPEQP